MYKIKRFLWFITLCLPVALNAQTEQSSGIKWTAGLSWQQIKQKAKDENKYVFIDCYASWCGPCKKMDREVYTDAGVFQFANEKFVSVKVQMDTTKNDNDDIKNWYHDASGLQFHYSVSAYPTFLFFSPAGVPLHKAVGYTSAKEFEQLMKDALEPDKQYYSVLNNFQPGKIDTNELKTLARSFEITDKDLAGKIAADYLSRIPQAMLQQPDNLQLMIELNESPSVQKIAHRYINSLPNELLFKRANIQLLKTFTETSRDKGFKIFLLQGKKIDSIMALRTAGLNTYVKPNYSEIVVDKIIYSEEIFPRMEEADSLKTDIDWIALRVAMSKKMRKGIVERNIINGKITWYKYKTQKSEMQKANEKIWGERFASALADKIEKYGLDTSGNGFMAVMSGNDIEYSIYRYCDNREIVNNALRWLETIMISQPGLAFSYVYAGLLYRLDRVKEAIEWQKMTLNIYEGQCYENKREVNSQWYTKQKEILNKMKRKEKWQDLIFIPE